MSKREVIKEQYRQYMMPMVYKFPEIFSTKVYDIHEYTWAMSIVYLNTIHHFGYNYIGNCI
jgi:hypothetical protein